VSATAAPLTAENKGRPNGDTRGPEGCKNAEAEFQAEIQLGANGVKKVRRGIDMIPLSLRGGSGGLVSPVAMAVVSVVSLAVAYT
jgi:hypothetical protein